MRGASRATRRRATRRGKPTAVPARGAPSLARAPGGPRSPSRGGRTHSGGRGAGKGVKLARGGSSSNARTTTLGENATKPGETRPEALTETRSRTGRPLTSQRPYACTSLEEGPPTSVRSAPSCPSRGGRGSQCRAETLGGEEKGGNGGGKWLGRDPSILCFQKRRTLKICR